MAGQWPEAVWKYDLLRTPLAFDWADLGIPFVDAVAAEIGALTETPSWSTSGPHGRLDVDVGATFECGPDPSVADGTRLLVVRLDDGIHLNVVGPGKPSGVINVWVRAVEAGLSVVAQPPAPHSWLAVVGADPEATFVSQAISQPFQVAEMHLAPTEHPLSEQVSTTFSPSFSSSRIVHSWPMIVEATAEARSTHDALLRATAPIHRLCAVLTLATDIVWVTREAPRPATWGRIHVPRSLPRGSDLSGPELATPELIAPPDKLQVLYAAVAADPLLSDALAVYYEGTRLQVRHPSFALVAFVSAIETVGGRLSPIQKCPECKNVCDAAKRFREAVWSVDPSSDKKDLNTLYSMRSGTAHSGALHGTEKTAASPMAFDLFGDGHEALLFAFSQVGRLREVARQLLLQVLGAIDGAR